MIKNGPHSTAYLRRVEKKYVYKAGLHATRFVAKIYLLTKLVEHKKSGLIFYFSLPFRQRDATCQLAATKDNRGSCVS